MTIAHDLRGGPTFLRDKEVPASLEDFPRQPIREIIQIKT